MLNGLKSYSEASYYANERFDEILDEISDFQTNLSMEVDNAVVNGECSFFGRSWLYNA
jgi:hypothetical protein